MELFLLFALAHVLTDYPLQTNWIYAQKTRGFAQGIFHSGTLLCCHLVLFFPYLSDQRVSISIIGLAAVHHLQDYIKIQLFDNKGRLILYAYLLDQVMHVAIFGGIAWVTSQYIMPLPLTNTDYVFWYHDPRVLIYAILLIIVTFAWETTSFVYRRDKQPDLIFQRNYMQMALRGAVFTSIYLGYIWLI